MNKKINYGVPSGFAGIDRAISGWRNSDLIIIASRPAMGKSAFVISMIKNIAVDGVITANGVEHIPCAVFSLEMSKDVWVQRLLFATANVDSQNIHENIDKIEIAKKKIMDKPIYLDDTPRLSVSDLCAKAKRFVSENGVRIIFIDYLQLMTDNSLNYSNCEEELAAIVHSLKSLAKELDIPIIALSQANNFIGKGGAETEETYKRALIRYFDGSVIKEVADVLSFIYRPGYYRLKEKICGEADFMISKCPYCLEKEITLVFNKSYALFSNPTTNINTL